MSTHNTNDPFAAIRALPTSHKNDRRPCDKCGKQSAWVHEALFYKGQYLCYDCITKLSQAAHTAALNALKREQEEAEKPQPPLISTPPPPSAPGAESP